MMLSDNLSKFMPMMESTSGMSGLKLTRAQLADANEIVHFMREFDEISFCHWQNEITMKAIICMENSRAYIARDDRETIVGAVVGGMMGTRATINHLAISPTYREKKIGTLLVDSITNDFYQCGVKRLFIFVSESNTAGRGFWKSQGFVQTRGEITCEKDL